MKYNKLVRDKVPEIIEGRGEKAVTHIADEKEYAEKLTEKLIEEIEEYKENPSIEEMADILEVLDAICELKGFDKDEVNKVKQEKKEKRGGFSRRIILEES